MATIVSTYLIIGGGLTGGSAVQGIREYDREGTIILVGEEEYLPYDRPYLTKDLWFGKKSLGDVYLQDREYYEKNGVDLALRTRIVSIDAEGKTATSRSGDVYRCEKMLLATGGMPRTLPIPGGTLDGICYYRYLDDYTSIRGQMKNGASAVVIGGGFIGSEIAAAMSANGAKVTMVFPSPYLCDRVFPADLGLALQEYYEEARGIGIVAGDRPSRISRKGGRFFTETEKGEVIPSDIIIVGVGIIPSVHLAREAGIVVEKGIVVDEYLQTSHPDIYAAGDNALFPYQALGKTMRIEHWDNAITQGKWAGWNMAGAHKPYTHMPYFFSDLFEFGYEAVGDVNSSLETFADWQRPNEKGVLYYLADGRIRGAMMCNIWGKVEAARDLIRKQESMTPERLRGAIREAA